MSAKDFNEVVELIVREDDRYEPAAYYFVRKALDHTLKERKKDHPEKKGQHVSGPELLDGIRDYCLEQYGPMSRTLLEHWGLRECKDFGRIVFNLVDYGVFGKTENDSLDDFEGNWTFHEAFEKPFEPVGPAEREKGNGASPDEPGCN